MTKLTARASAPHYLEEGVTLHYYHPLSFIPQADGSIQMGSDYDWKRLRFNVSNTRRTAVRADENHRYFYRDGWPEWTRLLDADDREKIKAALWGLRKLPMDDLPLELGVRMPVALVFTVFPAAGIHHPLESQADHWNEDTAVRYLESLKPQQREALKDIVHLNYNALDWALLQRRMKVAEALWGMDVRPSAYASEKALGWWALAGGFSLTPKVDQVNEQYGTGSVDGLEKNEQFLKTLQASIQNPLFSPRKWHTAWDTLMIVWLERLQDLPSNVNHGLAMSGGDQHPEPFNRTAFHHWLAEQRSSSTSDPDASQNAWLTAMKKQGYDFLAPLSDPMLGISEEEGLEGLAESVGMDRELIRSEKLQLKLPAVGETPKLPKPRF